MPATRKSLAFISTPQIDRRETPQLRRRIDEWKAEYNERHITVGRRPGPDAIVLANNDYLSLAHDPRITGAVAGALQDAGADVFMSSVYVQYLDQQQRFEAAMAAYLGAEAAVLCQSGWSANDGLIQAIADSDMPVYIDLFAHASLWQGIHSAGAKPRPFRHNDPEHLAQLAKRHGPGVVVVDSVYSTTGAICPLIDIIEVAERYGCMLVVDESHAIGLRGPDGAGMVAELGLIDRVQFRSFSLSKAFVGRAGIVAGSTRAMEFFRYQSRPAIFSSAVLPHETAGFQATLDAVIADDWRRTAVHRNAACLRAGLRDAGYCLTETDAPIIALVGGSEEKTGQLRDRLEAENIFGAVFCAPATPKNRSLLRLTVNAAMPQTALDHVIAVCSAIKQD